MKLCEAAFLLSASGCDYDWVACDFLQCLFESVQQLTQRIQSAAPDTERMRLCGLAWELLLRTLAQVIGNSVVDPFLLTDSFTQAYLNIFDITNRYSSDVIESAVSLAATVCSCLEKRQRKDGETATRSLEAALWSKWRSFGLLERISAEISLRDMSEGSGNNNTSGDVTQKKGVNGLLLPQEASIRIPSRFPTGKSSIGPLVFTKAGHRFLSEVAFPIAAIDSNEQTAIEVDNHSHDLVESRYGLQGETRHVGRRLCVSL
eukprot:GHVR01086900.1.p1 GENE.GHVR01086900.1~~GHVR01086900.1.p1  ORF type:complete len:261 (+),score=26.86 GHVR01086900.1:195-977(+)